jgi:hypothetical protein
LRHPKVTSSQGAQPRRKPPALPRLLHQHEAAHRDVHKRLACASGPALALKRRAGVAKVGCRRTWPPPAPSSESVASEK